MSDLGAVTKSLNHLLKNAMKIRISSGACSGSSSFERLSMSLQSARPNPSVSRHRWPFQMAPRGADAFATVRPVSRHRVLVQPTLSESSRPGRQAGAAAAKTANGRLLGSGVTQGPRGGPGPGLAREAGRPPPTASDSFLYAWRLEEWLSAVTLSHSHGHSQASRGHRDTLTAPVHPSPTPTQRSLIQVSLIFASTHPKNTLILKTNLNIHFHCKSNVRV